MHRVFPTLLLCLICLITILSMHLSFVVFMFLVFLSTLPMCFGPLYLIFPFNEVL